MKRSQQVLVFLFVLTFAVNFSTQAAVFTVSKTADTADGTCDADCSLREAITAANAVGGSDTVSVPAGTYTLTIASTNENSNADGDLDITSNITITGASGTSTIINANNIDRAIHILSAPVVSISNLTIQQGQAPNGSGANGAPGGGVLVADGTTDLSAVFIISNNSGEGDNRTGGTAYTGGCGGGLAIVNAVVTFEDGSISNNDTGGGGDADAGNQGGNGGNGGGVCLQGGTLTISRSLISSNNAGAGGIGNGGFAPGGPDDGLGGSGAGIAVSGGTATIENVTFFANTGGMGRDGGNGGALSVSGTGSTLLNNNTILANTPGNAGAGGIGGEGGGVYRSAGTLNIINSILADNNASVSGTSTDCSGNINVAHHNLIGDGTSCVGPANGVNGNIVGTSGTPADPLFATVSPANNGGPTNTVALQSASQARDAGENATCKVDDQRGETRSLTVGDPCDMGAYEFMCGNSTVDSTEACDDGDLTSGDGCSSTCSIESGFGCVGNPSVCTTTCGDNIKASSEACDDGDTTSGDGCSATCSVETGFGCAGNPSVCTTTCGDNIKASTEACDDGDTTSGDGCSSACAVESGYSCSGSPSTCSIVCGDGAMIGLEACDDGNTSNADGCSSSCSVETNYTCSGAPSVCVFGVCGDGDIGAEEECDDGNADGADGCSAACAVEAGYSCTGDSASECSPICGDSMIVGTEACDDANTENYDGCNSACRVEIGYTCTTDLPSVCSGICGDSIDKLVINRKISEDTYEEAVRTVTINGCDDGNTEDGDGCSSSCTLESGGQTVSNDDDETISEADQFNCDSVYNSDVSEDISTVAIGQDFSEYYFTNCTEAFSFSSSNTSACSLNSSINRSKIAILPSIAAYVPIFAVVLLLAQRKRKVLSGK